MAISPAAANRNVNTILGSTRQSILLKVGRKLHDYIYHLSNSQNEKTRNLSNLILDCLSFFPQNELFATAEEIFLTLLVENHSNVDQLFNKIFLVCQKGLGKAFLTCASTKRSKPYPFETIEKITLQFHEVLEKSQSSALMHCLPYDEGGADFLAFLANHPTVLKGIPDQDQPYCSPNLLVSPVPTRQGLINSKQNYNDFKSSALRYLASLSGGQRLGMHVYLKLFDTLENDRRCQNLKPILKNAMAKLLILATRQEGEMLLAQCSFEPLREIINECICFSENLGEDMLLSFCSICNPQEELRIDNIQRALWLVNVQLQELDATPFIQESLTQLSVGKMSLTQFIKELSNNIPAKNLERIQDEVETQKIVSRFRQDPSVAFSLPESFLDRIEKQYRIILGYCGDWRFLSLQELIGLTSVLQEKSKEGPLTDEQVLQLVAIGRLAIRLQFDIYLYNTQILALLGLLSYRTGCFAQIKTGEGKSMIVAMLAFIMTIQGKTVHIISSSQNLAKRDQQEFSRFFATFGIQTSHICVEDQQPCHFVGDILYGTATDFEFAIMREMLNFAPLFPTRATGKRFACAIIDEVDNLTIDTALNHARIGYPAETTYDWVYVPIFQFVMANVSFSQKNVLTSPSTIDSLQKYLQGYQNGIFAEVALQLSPERLGIWLKSAFHALHELKEKQDYVIKNQKHDKEGSIREIVIVDAKNTGRLLHRCRWSFGIHEFLEVKHGVEVNRESVTPLSLSHTVFYPMYETLYGLTGTLGSFNERQELKDIYEIECFDVPTHHPLQRQDSPPIILPTDEDVLKAIIQRITLYQGKGRPFLGLCETIEDSLAIDCAIKEISIPHVILNEIQEESEEKIIEQAGKPGAVTVATNTACRGTDIKLALNSLMNGGLHVALTFDPESDRVRDQARGRAGRQGQPGSSEIILSAKRLGLTNLSPESIQTYLKYLDKRRESSARVRRYVHTCRAELERYFYSFVKEFYEKLQNFMQAATNEKFINGKSEILGSRKLLNNNIKINGNLSVKDHTLAEEAIKLLTTNSITSVAWKSLLLSMAKRMKSKMLIDWSLHVYDPVENMINNSRLESYALLIEIKYKDLVNSSYENKKIEEMLKESTAEISKQTEEEKIRIKSLIFKSVKEHEKKWNKYFDASGNGLIEYLREITGTKLRNI
jgi:preprotein translocase subunit SecA